MAVERQQPHHRRPTHLSYCLYKTENIAAKKSSLRKASPFEVKGLVYAAAAVAVPAAMTLLRWAVLRTSDAPPTFITAAAHFSGRSSLTIC
jgi:hypothetical protein